MCLAGGVGGSKLLTGLARFVDHSRWTILGNTGDDIDLFGLRICPDLDTILYTLTRRVDPTNGWGLAGDTFNCLTELGRLGEIDWFRIGDRDLATHLFRTHRLTDGLSLSQVTSELCQLNRLSCDLVPMSDHFHPTLIESDQGEFSMQEYFVRERCRPRIRGIRFGNGSDSTAAAPGIVEKILEADRVILCPSNPLISIGPILSLDEIRSALRRTPAQVIAVTPLVGRRSLKGPSDKMMAELGLDVSALGVAKLYSDFVDVFILDQADEAEKERIERLGIPVRIADTVMKTQEDKERLAQVVLSL